METQPAHQHQPTAMTDESAMAELLDLDAEVLHSYLSEVVAWVRELAADLPGRRILDLGSGTGTGALALAKRFAGADVIALDISTPLLDRLREKAGNLGVADRIRTVQADLDAAWPAIDTVDLAWASNSLHHMADPDRVLTKVFATIRPGGLLAVAEMDAFPRFLPDDLGLGRPGLEARCHAALAEGHGRRATASRLRLGPAPAPGRLHHRGRADLRHRSDAPASPIHWPLRPGIPATHAVRPRQPDERR